MTDVDRFWSKVDTSGECWLWLASTRHGYGKFGRSGKRGGWTLAHRWAYEALVGPIPEGADLHHHCGVKHCVRPEHLEPLSRREHMTADGRLLSLRTHCAHGHPFDDENTRVNQNGSRACRRCHRERERERRRQSAHERSLLRREGARA